jgi:hypothetical protein
VLFFDTSKTKELLSGVIWGNVLYAITAIFTWIYIYKYLAKKQQSTNVLKKAILGLMVFYIFAFVTSGNILLISLFNLYHNLEAWRISIFAHLIYIASFFSGAFFSSKEE